LGCELLGRGGAGKIQPSGVITYFKGESVNIVDFQHNRAIIPQAALAPYEGKWVAFSSDGRNILGAGDTLEKLEEQLVFQGEDPQQVFLERITGPDDVTLPGAGELL
jgi:hypothetical protein